MQGKQIAEFRNVSKTFSSKEGEVHALSDINLQLYQGEILAVIGPSGAGKSTLLRMLNGLEKADRGTVIWQERELETLSARELNATRRKMGMIFQHFNLLAQRNVLDNVSLPLEIHGLSRDKARARAAELLDLVGLNDKARAYPAQLSGGQKQRVAIARALSTDPELLLCDEATSALDPATTHSILELLKKINRELGITLFVVTHEMQVVEHICDRVAVMDEGRIVELSSVKDLFKNPQSSAARKLIYPEGELLKRSYNGARLRLVFDGLSAEEPLISKIILEAKVPVNILYADSKNIEDKTYGQMLLALPDDESASERILALLEREGLSYSIDERELS
ncbi:MAG: ATP-binding cassette domain-containing protein [Eubacteriales bacterium]|nr:ATP-binding cassette domain-containing protein [Eubacteriales bacterium]MDD4324116.1 ATP-binding cassette domain-containing protein [Eubacteriales bacterium]MDD4541457.1 ATP-binding cassette domain-containing protein [Eubacteriales bacterium]